MKVILKTYRLSRRVGMDASGQTEFPDDRYGSYVDTRLWRGVPCSELDPTATPCT
jgi:hypothetical protein